VIAVSEVSSISSDEHPRKRRRDIVATESTNELKFLLVFIASLVKLYLPKLNKYS
jgi:hypothetical protein